MRSRTAGHCRRLRMPAIAAAPSRVQQCNSTPRTVRNSWPLRVDARAGYGPSGGGRLRDDQPRRAARRMRGGD